MNFCEFCKKRIPCSRTMCTTCAGKYDIYRRIHKIIPEKTYAKLEEPVFCNDAEQMIFIGLCR